MTPFQTYLLFRSLRFHFTTKAYDYFKYGGGISGDSLAHEARFNKDNSKAMYTLAARHDDPKGLIVANLIKQPNLFINEIISSKGQETYEKWVDRNDVLYYNLSQELEHFDSPKDLKKITPAGLPFVIERYMADDISPETVVLIDAVIHKLDEWEKIDHPLSQNIMKLRKYKGFVDVQHDKIRKTFERKYR